MNENDFAPHDYDDRPPRPAHVPESASDFDPYQFDGANRKFASTCAVVFFLLGIAGIIVYLVMR